MKRKTASIMVTDLVGYSAMMEKAEVEAARRVMAMQSLIRDKANEFGGRVFNTAGDAALVEFDSAVESVRCASEVQTALAAGNTHDGAPLSMRFGLHVADVIVQGEDLIGDGVNLAARIQQAAEPDQILVSGTLFDHIRRNSPFRFHPLGEKQFKNISEPVPVYRLVSEIGNHRMRIAPTRESVSTLRRPSSLAVLPMRSLGGDEDQRFLAEGFTEELIVELGRFRRLLVMSRTASFAIADQATGPRQVGELLGVSHVLEGQIRKLGSTVRMVLTLSETEEGTVVWTDKLQRPFDELMDVLDEVTSRVAATVSGRVLESSMVAARRKPPDNMSALECVFRGLEHHRLGSVTEDHTREALRWFDRAIELDPGFGPAYAWKVCSGSMLPGFNVQQARMDIDRAMELDPSNPETQRIMATFDLWGGNHEQALSRLRRAMEFNPSDAYMKARAATILCFMGEVPAAHRLLDEAEALDPLLPCWCVEQRGVAHYVESDFERSVAILDQLPFRTARSRLYAAVSLVALNRVPEAQHCVREAMAVRPGLSIKFCLFQERYQDPERMHTLVQRLTQAGLPA